MRLALVNGDRSEASPGLTGECDFCGSKMIAKCGIHRIWHWAHHGDHDCDRWWEPETEWHLHWKSKFPIEWQEVVHLAGDGERHIADVKTADGRVIEFQYSAISPRERQSRENFYGSMVWVVNGMRRKRDRLSFEKSLRTIRRDPTVYSVDRGECALLRDWVGGSVDVFFDFESPSLWHLHPSGPNGPARLTEISKEDFIRALRGAQRLGLALDPTPAPLLPPLSSAPQGRYSHQHVVQSFRQYLYARQISRRRF